MPAKYEMNITAADRRDLVNNIDMALIGGQARIGKGTYEVVIRRLSKAEAEKVAAEEKREHDENMASRPTHSFTLNDESERR